MTLATIAAVERETGLSKDTLRVWERRYGFPRPVRDDHDERMYPAEQVERLRLIRRLIDQGFRPSKVVGATVRELAALAGAGSAGEPAAGAVPQSLRELMALVESGDAALGSALARERMRLGLLRFAIEVIAPLNVLVGEAWARGRIAVWHEHLYSEQAQAILREGIAAIGPGTGAPVVILTTVPGEAHHLGLLLAQSCLVLEGARCIALGAQTPLHEICKAATAYDADIVALSFSPTQRPHVARGVLTQLRAMLERRIALWAGGTVWARQRRAIAGVETFSDLRDIPAAVAAWRAGKSRPGTSRAAARGEPRRRRR